MSTSRSSIEVEVVEGVVAGDDSRCRGWEVSGELEMEEDFSDDGGI
jgi:hypothetical protein